MEENIKIQTGEEENAVSGREKLVRRHVKEWIDNARIIESYRDRFQGNEEEAYNYIRKIVDGNGIDDHENLLASQTVIHQAGSEYHDEFGTALNRFASKVRFIISDFEVFRNLVREQEKNGSAQATRPTLGNTQLTIGTISSDASETQTPFGGAAAADVKIPSWMGASANRQQSAGLDQKAQRRVVVGDAVMEGWFIGDRPVDRGKITYNDNCFYEGDWNEYGPHGFGTFTNGDYREVGQFVNGKNSGNGRIEYGNGSWYEGDWNEKGPHGQGVEVDDDVRYSGMYVDGERFGSGRIEYGDGSWYEGGWNHEGRHGRGIYYDAESKMRYIGTFRDDAPVENGRIEWEDGTWYEGGWNEYGQHGQGVTHRKVHKRVDKGSYKNGCRDGNGRMEWENGSWYEGGWNDKGFLGEGVYYNSNTGDRFKGVFGKNGNPTDGYGKIEFATGRIYNGEWKDLDCHGKGELYCPESKRKFVTTFNENMVGTSGKIIFDDGSVLEGSWEFEKDTLNTPVMVGTLTRPDSFQITSRLRGLVPYSNKITVNYVVNGFRYHYEGEDISSADEKTLYQGTLAISDNNGAVFRREVGTFRVEGLSVDCFKWKGREAEHDKKMNIVSWAIFAVGIFVMFLAKTEPGASIIFAVIAMIGGLFNSNRKQSMSQGIYYTVMTLWGIFSIMGWVELGSEFPFWRFFLIGIVFYFLQAIYFSIRKKV